MITLTNLEKIYRTKEIETVALENVNLTVNKGEFLSIMGPSGCGKSTLLNIIGLLDAPTSGTVEIAGINTINMNDKQLAEFRNQKLGFVFQSFHLINSLNVLDNVELPLLYRKVSAKERREAAVAVLEKVGLSHRMRHFPTQLSGGQCQRLVIARALLRSDSAVYIFDEAASNIDVESEEMIMNVIHELAKTKTVLLISHRLANVVQSDQIYFLKNGTICERGTHAELMEQNGAYRHLYDSQMVLENYGKKNEMLKTIPPIPLRYIEVKDSLNPTAPPELKQTISPAVSWLSRFSRSALAARTWSM